MVQEKDIGFKERAESLLEKIVDSLEFSDPEGDMELELNDGVLKIQKDGEIFVINKNSAAREIWVASPLSGPAHFRYKGQGVWLSGAGENLYSLLERELGIKL